MTVERLGSFELVSARAAASHGRARRFASPNDCLALLRVHRLDRGVVRALVRRAGVTLRARGDDEALRALASLVYRGEYLICERAPVRVPQLEIPGEYEGVEPDERENEESEGDGLPTAIVPREYPLLASRLMNGVWVAEKAVEAELNKHLWTGMGENEPDRVPIVYRQMGETKGVEIVAATALAAKNLEPLEYVTFSDAGAEAVPAAYRDVASTSSVTVQDVVGTVADSLAKLQYGSLDELLVTEQRLHSEGVPHEFRRVSADKGSGVKEATSNAASQLDQLLYNGFEEAP